MRELVRRILYVLRYRQREDDLAEELEFHREMKQRQLEAGGMDRVSASIAARRAIGNVQGSRQYARDVWIAPRLQEAWQDIRFAIRLLLRDRGFAAAAIVVLGFGIGINNMLFTVLYAHTIRGLPIPRPGRVLHVSMAEERVADRPLSFLEFENLRINARSFEALAAFASAPVAIGDEQRAPDRVESAYVSANAFAVLGIHPVLGRDFAEDDDRRGAPPVVILGSAEWTSRYDGNESILGHDILVNGSPATVIGIMPPRSGFPSTAEIWLPLAHLPGLVTDQRDTPALRTYGRIRDDVQASDAQAEVESLVARGLDGAETSGRLKARVMPINQRVLGRLTDPAWLAFMTFGCLALVISCANVANLMLARGATRTREIAIRSSLGATRVRVMRQLLIESSVLAAAGGVLGIGISVAGVRIFRSAIPANLLPYWLDYSLDGPVIVALAGVSVAAVFIFGLVPSLHASKADVIAVLKTGGRGMVEARGSRRWTTAFMAVELGVTVVMMSYFVLDVRSPGAEIASDRVIDTDDVLTASLTLPAERYRTIEDRHAFYRRLESRIDGLAAVSSRALTSALPRRGAAEQRLEIEGRTLDTGKATPGVWTVAVGSGYFETLGLPLERGRAFNAADADPDANTVIVNRRWVDLYFAKGDPIGKRIRLTPPTGSSTPPAWLTIIGIAQSIRQRPPSVPDPVAYVPFERAAPATANLLLRTTAERSAVANALRGEMLGLDPNLPLYRMLTLAQVIDEVEWNGRVSSRIVRAITLLALAFSIVGLYAVTAHAVAERTQEIGMRIALGARPAQLCWMVVARASFQVALGLVLGVLGTVAWEAVFLSGRIDRRIASPHVLGPVAALLAAGTLAACALPVLRATRVDPVAALKSD